MCINAKTIPINYNAWSYHTYTSCRTCLTNRMRSISRHIMPLVINSLGRGHTHTHTHTHTHKHADWWSTQDQFLETRRMPGIKIMNFTIALTRWNLQESKDWTFMDNILYTGKCLWCVDYHLVCGWCLNHKFHTVYL